MKNQSNFIISGNDHFSIGSREAAKISAVLKTSDPKMVEIWDPSINDEVAKHIAEALPHLKLTTFTMLGNGITDSGTKLLVDALQPSKKTLQKVHLLFDQASAIGTEHVSKNLLKGSNITSLTFRSLEDSNAGIVTHFKDSQISSAMLIFDVLNEKGAHAIANALVESKLVHLTVNRLNFYGDGQNDDEIVGIIADALPRSPLLSLIISFDNLTDQGVGRIANALKESSLINIDIHSNHISDQRLKLIEAALGESKLRSLSIESDKISKGAQKAFKEEVDRIRKIHLENLSNDSNGVSEKSQSNDSDDVSETSQSTTNQALSMSASLMTFILILSLFI